MKKLYFMIIPAALAVAGTFFFALYTAPEITWKPNAGQMYRLEMESKVGMNYQGDTAGLVSRLNAILNFRITQVLDDEINATMQLSDISFTYNNTRNPLYEQILSGPFQVKFARSGGVLGYSFVNIARGDDKFFRGIVSSLVCISKKSLFGRWSLSEKDEYGTYDADYSSYNDGTIIYKIKDRYTESEHRSVANAGKTDISIVKSKARFDFSKEISWVKEIDSFELVRFFAGGKKTMDARKKVTLLITEFKPDMNLAIWSGKYIPGYRMLYESWTDECAGCRDMEYSYEYLMEREAMKQLIKNDTIEGVLSKISRSDGNDPKQAKKLKIFIILYPDVVKRIYNETVRKRYSNSALSLIMRAMVEAGNESAQEYLRKIALDQNVGKTVNLMSTVNIGSLENPSAETIATLKQVYAARDNDMNAMISNSSILSLGRIASSMKSQEKGMDGEKEIAEYIAGQLGANSKDPNIAASCVAALGTIGDKQYFGTVKSYLGSDSGFVRSSAISALTNFDEEDVPEILRDHFESEKDEAARKTVIESLAKYPVDEDSIDMIKDTLPGEKSERVRNAMFHYLASASDKDPEIKDVLRKALKTEGSNTNRDVIFRVLYSKKKESPK